MGRKKNTTEEFIQKELVDTSLVDSMFESVCDEMKKEYGSDNVFSGGDEEKLSVCLPVPALSARYFLKSEGLPLNKFLMLIGEQESFKSSFTDEVIRWHRVAKGGGVKVEVESKDWPELRHSILQYDMLACKSIRCDSADGENGWMQALSGWIKKIKHIFEPLVQSGPRKGLPKEEALGRIAPYCFVIDSLAGGLSQSTLDKIDADGAPRMSFPIEARKISDYLKAMPKWLLGWPFTVIAINHKKVNKQPDGTVVISIPGGKALKFAESIEIDMRRMQRETERVRDKETFVRVKMETTKNSTAPRGEIEVEIVWWFDDTHRNAFGQRRQVTIFDWHTATIELLAGFEGGKATEIAEVIDLHVNKDQRKVWSKALGISEKKPVRWREAGAMLEQRPDLLYPLYDILGIRRRLLFKPGIDFRKQWDDYVGKVETPVQETVLDDGEVVSSTAEESYLSDS